MTARWLDPLAFAIAASSALVLVVSPFSEGARHAFVRPMTWAAAGVAAVLFVALLADPGSRRGVAAANRVLQGDRPFGMRWLRLSDPQWGLFGSRGGDPPLLVLRTILFVEFLVVLALNGQIGADLVALAFAGLIVAILLSLRQLGRDVPPL
jgi:hypothetical protein